MEADAGLTGLSAGTAPYSCLNSGVLGFQAASCHCPRLLESHPVSPVRLYVVVEYNVEQGQPFSLPDPSACWAEQHACRFVPSSLLLIRASSFMYAAKCSLFPYPLIKTKKVSPRFSPHLFHHLLPETLMGSPALRFGVHLALKKGKG